MSRVVISITSGAYPQAKDDGGARPYHHAMSDDTPALEALAATDLEFRVLRFEPPRDVHESAAAQGIAVGAVVKTIVVRRGDDDYVLVLVPGNRVIDWPKLRALLDVRRLTMPPAEEAEAATGYTRGSVTPFGTTRQWPVIADAAVAARSLVGIGGGRLGVAVHLRSSDLIDYCGAVVADITKPAS
jgi:Cys-tRNA(Pro) deacylase